MSLLATKRAEYKSLRDDYKELTDKLKDNVQRKKALRDEIAAIQKQNKIEKAQKVLEATKQ